MFNHLVTNLIQFGVILFAILSCQTAFAAQVGDCKQNSGYLWSSVGSASDGQSVVMVVGEIHGIRPSLNKETLIHCWLNKFDHIILEVNELDLDNSNLQKRPGCLTDRGERVWSTAFQLQLQAQTSRAGYVRATTLTDFILLNPSRIGKSRIFGIEKASDQIDLFDNLPCKVQEAFLSQTILDLGNGVSAAQEKRILRAYDSGGLVDLEQSFSGVGTSSVCDECFEIMNERLLLNRNETFANYIAASIQSKGGKKYSRTLVIVGIGHLLGPRSMINLLNERGFKMPKISRKNNSGLRVTR